MQLARQVQNITNLVDGIGSFIKPFNREEEEDIPKLDGLLDELRNLFGKIEAIALDHVGSFQDELKYALMPLLEIFLKTKLVCFEWRQWGINPHDYRIEIRICDISPESNDYLRDHNYDPLYFFQKIYSYADEIERTLLVILHDEIDPLKALSKEAAPEVAIAWWAAAPPRLVPYLQEADKLAMLPHDLKEERSKCGWDEDRKALNRFLAKHAPDKKFKFSVNRNRLQVIPKPAGD